MVHNWRPSANVKLVGLERTAISALQLTTAPIQTTKGVEFSPVCSQMNVDVKEILKIILIQKMWRAALYGLHQDHVKMMQIVLILRSVRAYQQIILMDFVVVRHHPKNRWMLRILPGRS